MPVAHADADEKTEDQVAEVKEEEDAAEGEGAAEEEEEEPEDVSVLKSFRWSPGLRYIVSCNR